MRTTLDLDDALLDALAARFPGRTKTQAIEAAVAAFLADDAATWLRAQAGTVEFDEEGWLTGRAADRERAERLVDAWTSEPR